MLRDFAGLQIHRSGFYEHSNKIIIMFLFITFIIPALIILLGKYFLKRKETKIDKRKFINLIIPGLYIYVVILYYLTLSYPEILGWEFYSLLFFLIPITILVFLWNMYFYFKKFINRHNVKNKTFR